MDRREGPGKTADSLTPGLPASRSRLLDQNAPAARRPRTRPLISSALIGSANRGRVLQTLFDVGPTSRAELARLAGVNRTTISGIVQPLIDRGLLVERKPVRTAGGGKPAKPLWFAADAGPICGAMLLPNLVRTALVSLDGAISAEHAAAIPLGVRSADPIIQAFGDCLARTLAEAHRAPLGIGVAVGGMVDTDQNAIVAVNLAPVLSGYPLGAELTRRFRLPVSIDHHPRAMLLGDRWFGLGRGRGHFAAVYTGEVLGGALYLNGHLYRGPAGAGGELGHTFVQVDGALCRCGRRGCWETIATLSWLRGEGRRVGLPDPDRLSSARLVALAEAGATEAADLIDRYARNVAIGIANLQQTVSPNLFVLHGDVVGGGTRMLAAIARHAGLLVPPRPGGEMTLVLGDIEDRATLRGAAGLILSEQLHFPL